MAFTATMYEQKNTYSNEKIIFNQVLTNEGGAYDGTSGVFTCPSSGVYAFTWTIMTLRNQKSCETFLSINGTVQSLAAFASLEGITYEAYTQSTMSTSVRLSAGDRVWVHTTDCHYLYDMPYSAFSGWKL